MSTVNKWNFSVLEVKCSAECTIPFKLRGTWFSWENGRNTLTEIDDTTMTGRGRCMEIREERYVNYTTSFKRDGCYTCVKFLVRTTNIIEKMESESQNRKYNLIFNLIIYYRLIFSYVSEYSRRLSEFRPRLCRINYRSAVDNVV